MTPWYLRKCGKKRTHNAEIPFHTWSFFFLYSFVGKKHRHNRYRNNGNWCVNTVISSQFFFSTRPAKHLFHSIRHFTHFIFFVIFRFRTFWIIFLFSIFFYFNFKFPSNYCVTVCYSCESTIIHWIWVTSSKNSLTCVFFSNHYRCGHCIILTHLLNSAK